MAKPEPKGYGAKTARGERPFVYSDQYQNWFSAVRRGWDGEFEDYQWRKRFARHTIR